MKIVYLVLSLILLSGCSLMMGTTEYTLTPIEKANGELVCCEATVFNSKNYKSLKFKFVKSNDGSITVTLDEDGVSASDPAAIQAEANIKFLDAITKIIPKAN